MEARILPRLGLSSALALALACGASSAPIKIPDKPLPSKFDDQSGAEDIAKVGWGEYFSDEHLNALIADALAGNPDVYIALQRIELARAGVRQATGIMMPEVSAAAGVGVMRAGQYTSEGAGNRSTEIAPGQLTPTPLGDFYVGLQSSWEIDAWGKLKNQRKAAAARYLVSVEGLSLVKTSLIAAVARAYFELLALDHKGAILAETVARQQQALEVVRLQKEAGRANELAVQQFAAQLASTQALEAETLRQIRETENGINFLRGSYPREVARSKDVLLQTVASRLDAGLPSSLLLNRPDVRQVEQAVRASKFDVRAARAAFYPSINISAGIGYQAFNPKFLIETPASIFYSATAGLIAPLINRAAIEAQFDAAEAIQIEAMYEYQKVVLQAYMEVANGLAVLQRNAEIVTFKREQRAAVEQTVATADALFRAGKASYYEVLLAQQNTLAADLELIDALRGGRLASIEIYRALGGGWH
jgi:multidrug efflux system outer membrane protein